MNTNSTCSCPGTSSRAKRSDSSKGATSRAQSRLGNVNINRTPVYFDEAALTSMMTNSQFMPHFFPRPQQSTPVAGSFPSQHETFGSHIEYNPMTLQQNLGNVPDTQSKDSRFLLNNELEEEKTEHLAEKQESVLEWFDKTVEKELQKRRDTSLPATFAVDKALVEQKRRHSLNLSRGTLERMSEASASRVELDTALRKQPDTELTTAVDQLAKAEAMCSFAGAVKAAEAALEQAPPGKEEEAAAAGVKVFNTDVAEASFINETLPGVRPVEVLGYVGVTAPKYPRKS